MIFQFFALSDEDKGLLNQLLCRVSGGDKNALAQIFSVAGGHMLSVALGLMRNKQMAEDVLQESFLRIARFSTKYKAGTNAYAWLCTVVKNTAYNKIKSENLRRTSCIDDFHNIASTGNWYEDRVNAIAVQDALRRLLPKERTAVWLKYFNDMTVREIAAEMDMPRSTVQDLIASGEKNLKKLLKESDN